MKQIMDGFVLDIGRETCTVCGQLVEFAENQYSKACSCGNVITLPPFRVRSTRTVAVSNVPECFLCLDTGLVFYKSQVNGYLYEFVARCKCAAGQQHPDQGIPSVDRVNNIADLRFLEMRARKEWEKHGAAPSL